MNGQMPVLPHVAALGTRHCAVYCCTMHKASCCILLPPGDVQGAPEIPMAKTTASASCLLCRPSRSFVVTAVTRPLASSRCTSLTRLLPARRAQSFTPLSSSSHPQPGAKECVRYDSLVQSCVGEVRQPGAELSGCGMTAWRRAEWVSMTTWGRAEWVRYEICYI